MKRIAISITFSIILTLILFSCSESATSADESGDLLELSIDEGTNMAVALSPDGQTLAFDVLGRIWLMPAEGGAAKAITDSLGNARQPAWSPDGEQFTFQGYWQGNWHIYTINKDGSNLKQLTSGKFDYREPHWSPDGTTIAFASDRSGNYDIWTLDLVGEQLLPATTGPDNEYGPSWSPDGTQLAYVSGNGSTGKVVIRTIAGSTEKAVYEGKGKLTGISWAPQGDGLLVNEHEGIRAQLKQVNLATGDSEIITDENEDVYPFRHVWNSDNSVMYTGTGKIQTKPPEGSSQVIPFSAKLWLQRKPYARKKRDFDEEGPHPVKGIVWPALSPDAKRVVFVALQDLWIRNDDGTVQQLTNDPFVQIMPTWSPDGRSIAYSSDKDGPFGIWRKDLATGEEMKLLETGGAVSGMAWSPNGNYIAFTESFGPRGGQLNLLNVSTMDRSSMGEQLGSSVGTPTWSPDSKIVALTVLAPYSGMYREGVNRIMLFPIDGSPSRAQKASEHWSFGVRGNDGPVWSPDGKYMAVMGSGNLWLMPVDKNGDATGDPTRLTTELSDAPTWSADSKQLLYMATDRLKVISPDDGSTRDLPIDMTWERKFPIETTIVHAGGLINGVQDSVIRNVDIVITGHRITDIAPHDDNRQGNRLIDASDAFVMPGLIDIHAHEGSTEGEKLGRAWLSWGVTTMRNPSGDPLDALNRRESIQSGKIWGPRIYFTGSPIDGNRIFYSGASALGSADQIDMELKRAEQLDYDLIKTYVRLSNPLQQRVVEGAHRIGLPVTSHELYPAVAFNTDGVEHVRGTSRMGFSAKLSETLRAYDDVTDLLAVSGMSFTPTTAIYMGYNYVIARDPSVMEDQRLQELTELRYLASVSVSTEQIRKEQANYDRLYANLIRMVADVHRKGGFVTAGTDSPILPQGFALHIELENYQDAGLTPFEVLQTATVNNARALNASDDLGAVEVGKLADIVIVETNPLEDIRNARNIRSVIKNGEVLPLEKILQRPD